MERKSRAKQVALLGMLGAVAIVLSWLEGMLGPVPGLPPGAKLGLSNVATMLAASTMGPGSAMAIALLKGLFAGLTRGLTAGLMSLSGGLLSTGVVCLLLWWKRCPLGYIGIGIAGAVCHNLGQLFLFADKRRRFCLPALFAAVRFAGRGGHRAYLAYFTAGLLPASGRKVTFGYPYGIMETKLYRTR